MLKKKYTSLHKSILMSKYLVRSMSLKHMALTKLNFFFLSFSKKENLAVFKNIVLSMITGRALNSKYSKLYVNQFYNNLAYMLSFTKSTYNIMNFFLIQKLFLSLNNLHMYVSSGQLDLNTFFSYTLIKSDCFIDSYLIYDVKYIKQKTYLTGSLKWQFAYNYNWLDNINLSLTSLFFFDLLNLWSVPFLGSFAEVATVRRLLEKIK